MKLNSNSTSIPNFYTTYLKSSHSPHCIQTLIFDVNPLQSVRTIHSINSQDGVV